MELLQEYTTKRQHGNVRHGRCTFINFARALDTYLGTMNLLKGDGMVTPNGLKISKHIRGHKYHYQIPEVHQIRINDDLLEDSLAFLKGKEFVFHLPFRIIDWILNHQVSFLIFFSSRHQ